jgi:hypothetical protein
MFTWWRQYGPDLRLALVAVRDGERLIGLAPLCQDARPDRHG